MHPLENMPDYGREITNVVSTVSLVLLLDDPEQQHETLLLRFVQLGIDYYGVTFAVPPCRMGASRLSAKRVMEVSR